MDGTAARDKKIEQSWLEINKIGNNTLYRVSLQATFLFWNAHDATHEKYTNS